MPLRILHTEYASVAGPIVAYVDRLRQHRATGVFVLIPVALPGKLRYRFLHNHLDLVLTRALRGRRDVVVARIPVPLRVDDDPAWAGPADGTSRHEDAQGVARRRGWTP